MRPVFIPISAVDIGADTFTIGGNHTAYFGAAVTFTVWGSTGNDGAYTSTGAVKSGATTVISVSQDITDATVDGYVLLEGDSALRAHMAGETTSLASCVRITRTDGGVYAFTDHDTDVVWDGVTHSAQGGYVPTTIVTTAELAVDNLSAAGPFAVGGVLKADLTAGLYDYAEVWVYDLNYAGTWQGAMVHAAGRWGEVKYGDHRFEAEFRSKLQALQETVGEVTTPDCRVNLGHWRCGIVLASWTETGSVDVGGVVDDHEFAATIDAPYVSTPESADWFKYGQLTWTSGSNNGLSMEVKSQAYAAGTWTFVLARDMPYTIAAGDTFSVYAGCDRHWDGSTGDCKDKFSNLVNYQGEPFITGETVAADYGVLL